MILIPFLLRAKGVYCHYHIIDIYDKIVTNADLYKIIVKDAHELGGESMILIIREAVTPEQINQMTEWFGSNFIKLAVDVEQEILAGGGELHSDCEQALLEEGSQQVNVWGADWHPESRKVTFESIINIRPQQQSFSMDIQDLTLRSRIEKIVRELLEVN